MRLRIWQSIPLLDCRLITTLSRPWRLQLLLTEADCPDSGRTFDANF